MGGGSWTMMTRVMGRRIGEAGGSCVCTGHRSGGESQCLSGPPRSRQQAPGEPTDRDQAGEVLSSLFNVILVK